MQTLIIWSLDPRTLTEMVPCRFLLYAISDDDMGLMDMISKLQAISGDIMDLMNMHLY